MDVQPLVALALGALVLGGALPPAPDAAAAGCESPGCVRWARAIAAPVASVSNHIAFLLPSADGRSLYALGIESGGPATGLDWSIRRLDATTGASLWDVHADQGSSGTDLIAGAALSPDGSRLVVAGTRGGSSEAIRTVAYSTATGAPVWSVTRDAGSAAALAVSPDGSRAYLAARQGSPAHVLVLAFDPAHGGEVWRASFVRGSNDYPEGLAVTPEGDRVLVAARTISATTGRWEFSAFALDASDGAMLWSATHALAGHHVAATDAALLPGGPFVMAGSFWKDSISPEDALAVAYDPATGSTAWTATYSGATLDKARRVLPSSDGSGLYMGVESGGDVAVVSLASDGATRWAARYNGSATGSDFVRTLATDGRRVYVAGEADLGPQNDLFVLALDAATGARGWNMTFDLEGARDAATALAFDPADTRLHVGGSGRRADSTDAQLALSLFLRDPPGAPQNVDAAPAPLVSPPGSVRVVWTPPASDGASPILGYDVFMEGELVASLPPEARHHDVGGMMPLEARLFGVRAFNAVGPGPTVTTCGVPSPFVENAVVPCETLRDTL